MNELSEKNANQSVIKLLLLLSSLSESRTPVRLQEIAAQINMPQATVLRYLNALIQEGYAFQDTLSGRYALTWKIAEIGDQIRAHMNLRSISGDIVNDLANKIDFGICLVVEQDMECVYLDCLYEPTALSSPLVRIGKQTPLHATGSGKILLSAFTETELDYLIAKKGLPKLTEKTITTKAAMLEELARVRQQGYAFDDEECEEGLRCISVPIYGCRQRLVAAISAFGAAERICEQCIQNDILPHLKPAAEQISFRLGAG